MVDLMLILTSAEAEIMEEQRKTQQEKRRAEEKGAEAQEKLRIVRVAKREASFSVGGKAVAVGEDSKALVVPRQIVDPTDPDYKFLWPAWEPGSDDPIYDPRVVAGHKTNRERGYAAARVYGTSIREKSLAQAIFETGETSAKDASSARGSLGSLVKYGGEWTRLRGWLYYVDDLEPNEEMIRRLADEASEAATKRTQ